MAIYHTADRRLQMVELPIPAVQVPRDEAARMEEPIRRALEGRGTTTGMSRGEVDRLVAAPSWIPAVDELFVTPGGEIWLREPNFGERTHLWRVVGADGALTATVEVPDGIVLHDRAGNHLWGVRTDSTFGVTSVVRLRMERVTQGRR